METETPDTRRRPRMWLLGLLGLALVGLVAYNMWPQGSAAPTAPASNRARNTRPGPRDPQAIDPEDLKDKLDALQAKRPDPGPVDRNPFRFRPPPAPPAPPKPPPVTLPPVGPPPDPGPPPVPPIPLRFMGTIERGGLKLAALTDCKGSTYVGEEGKIVDGRYKLVRIQNESVVMEYPNGTGRLTIRKSGECPK
jgi:hypothetical protein